MEVCASVTPNPEVVHRKSTACVGRSKVGGTVEKTFTVGACEYKEKRRNKRGVVSRWDRILGKMKENKYQTEDVILP